MAMATTPIIIVRGRPYEAALNGDRIDITEYGAFVGSARWQSQGIVARHVTLGPGEHLSADEAQAISDEIYSSIEAEIRAALARQAEKATAVAAERRDRRGPWWVEELRDGHPLDRRVLHCARDEEHALRIRAAIVARHPVRIGPNGPVDLVSVLAGPVPRTAPGCTTVVVPTSGAATRGG